MNDVLLVIHVVSAMVWVGGAVFALFVGPRLAQQGPPVAMGWMKAMQAAATSLLIPAAILTGLAGIGLVVTDDAYGWSDLFVNLGLVVVVVALVIAYGVNIPSLRRAIAAAESGDMPTVGANAGKIVLANRVIVVLQFIAVVAMVLRLGV